MQEPNIQHVHRKAANTIVAILDEHSNLKDGVTICAMYNLMQILEAMPSGTPVTDVIKDMAADCFTTMTIKIYSIDRVEPCAAEDLTLCNNLVQSQKEKENGSIRP